MLDDLKVKDVYLKTEDYPNISVNAPLGQAFHLMHHVLEDKTKFRTILVLDDDNRLKGYLSLRDLISAVGPDYLKKCHPHFMRNQPISGFCQDLTSLSVIWQEGFTLKLHDELNKPVSECMTPMEDLVILDDPIAKCLYTMLANDVLVLPVVEDEHVIGVIRLVDLFERIADNVEQAWMPEQK
ncbi:MAG: CBS domain-containing protein [Gammaproteobacteria bacterium]|nr:CBS domain-containing protein [Gammaproteobacteria bacterium]